MGLNPGAPCKYTPLCLDYSYDRCRGVFTRTFSRIKLVPYIDAKLGIGFEENDKRH